MKRLDDKSFAAAIAIAVAGNAAPLLRVVVWIAAQREAPLAHTSVVPLSGVTFTPKRSRGECSTIAPRGVRIVFFYRQQKLELAP